MAEVRFTAQERQEVEDLIALGMARVDAEFAVAIEHGYSQGDVVAVDDDPKT